MFLLKFIVVGMAMLMSPAAATAAAGESIYKDKCSACHDSGAGLAPRVQVRGDWLAREKRGRNAMYASAIGGVPLTAMAAKGGFSELTDAEVKLAVDYMLLRVGFRDDQAVVGVAPGGVAPAANATAPVSDADLVSRVAEALQKALAPQARIEHYAGDATLRGVTIRVSARGGVVTLAGVVENAALIPRAQTVAQGVGGVCSVNMKLVGAGMLDFD